MNEETTLQMEIGGTLMTVRVSYRRWRGRIEELEATDEAGEPLALSDLEARQLHRRVSYSLN